MKYLSFFMLSYLFFACAHNPNKGVEKSVEVYESKNHSEIENDVQKLLNNHPEFDTTIKEKIREILLFSLEENKRLKEKESQYAQHLIQLTLVEKSSYGEIAKLRKAMSWNYRQKIKLFEKTALDLKKVIGIKQASTDTNSSIIPESGALFR